MAEVNDLFIRSLRNSTRRKAGVQNGTGVTLSKPQTSTRQLTSHHLSSAADLAENASKKDQHHSMAMPPDLLANLTPRPSSRSQISSTRSSTVPQQDQQPEERLPSRLPVSTPPTKKRWNPFSTKATNLSTQLLKEYRTPSNLLQTSTSGRRYSACTNNTPIESQVRVVPTWFPPSNISKLKRQDSFHGETAASRLLSAKRRAQRMALQEQRNSLTGTDAGRNCDAFTTLDEESSGVPAEQSGDTTRRSSPDEASSAIPSNICPRHAKHHRISIPPVAENDEEFCLDSSGNFSESGRPVASPRKPKQMFKFGTLPRSFKVSGRSSPAPSSVQNVFKWAPVDSTPDENEAGPKSAPPVFRRVKSFNNKKSGKTRNSWHVSTPVIRSDVALPNTEVWFNDENCAPAAQEQLCVTCGDTRKHVHLVKMADDLTLTDTRYFIGANGEEVPETPTVLSGEGLSRWNNDKEKWVMEQVSSRETSPEYEEERLSTIMAPDEDESLQRMSESLNYTVRKDIDNFGLQDRSMFSKLLDLSDQIRQWKGPRTHRIRSVDSSPVLSHTKITTGSESFGKVPSLLLGTSIKSIPEEIVRLPRTCSMENLHHNTRCKDTMFNGTPFAVRFIDPDVPASQFRSNIHLSYSELLKNTSKLWSSPSRSGSMSIPSNTTLRGTSGCILNRLL